MPLNNNNKNSVSLTAATLILIIISLSYWPTISSQNTPADDECFTKADLVEQLKHRCVGIKDKKLADFSLEIYCFDVYSVLRLIIGRIHPSDVEEVSDLVRNDCKPTTDESPRGQCLQKYCINIIGCYNLIVAGNGGHCSTPPPPTT